MRLNKGRQQLMLIGMAVIGVGLLIGFGSYYAGLLNETNPVLRHSTLFFLGMVIGAGFVAFGCWYIVDSVS